MKQITIRECIALSTFLFFHEKISVQELFHNLSKRLNATYRVPTFFWEFTSFEACSVIFLMSILTNGVAATVGERYY